MSCWTKVFVLPDVQQSTMQHKEHSQVNYSSVESLGQDGWKYC